MLPSTVTLPLFVFKPSFVTNAFMPPLKKPLNANLSGMFTLVGIDFGGAKT